MNPASSYEQISASELEAFVASFIMDAPTTTTAIAVSLLFRLISIYLIQWAIAPQHDPRKPPIIRSWIPILGHAGPLVAKGMRHFTNLW